MQTCTRRFEWDAAHRVLGHKGKCRHLHGHRYAAEVTVSARKLNDLSMVIDFAIIKDVIGAWIDSMWDHNILLNEKDPLANLYDIGEAEARRNSQSMNPSEIEYIANRVFNGRDPYIFRGDNPTAEAIAFELFNKAEALLHENGIRIVNVRVWETPNCYADYNRQVGGQYHAG